MTRMASITLSSLVLNAVFGAVVGLTVGCQSSTKNEATKPEAAKAKPAMPTTLEAAVASEYRTPENKIRDPYRHPLETLKFFGIESNMTVVEISPGRGWYAQILAPYLNTNGRYIAAAVPVSVYAGGEAFVDWMNANPELAAKSTIVDFLPGQKPIAEPNSADAVLTFRNIHNWISSGSEAAAFKSFFEVLKPGGTLGVVEHRENPKKKKDPKAANGYVREVDVIAMAKKAGFKLVAQTEVNANPKDTKDYAKGVWTLPPSYRLGDQDREKYAAIGESDRMTLKFMKPH